MSVLLIGTCSKFCRLSDDEKEDPLDEKCKILLWTDFHNDIDSSSDNVTAIVLTS